MKKLFRKIIAIYNRCRYCGRTIEDTSAGSEPRPNMCERCFENGGDE